MVAKKTCIFIILLSLSGVWSCRSARYGNAIVVTGIIQTVGITTYMYGTHRLVDDNNETTYPLQSSTVSLNDFENNRVRIKAVPVKGYPLQGGPELLSVLSLKVIGK
jgi:hypothetical protein